jgi:hypothetical protein
MSNRVKAATWMSATFDLLSIRQKRRRKPPSAEPELSGSRGDAGIEKSWEGLLRRNNIISTFGQKQTEREFQIAGICRMIWIVSMTLIAVVECFFFVAVIWQLL